MKLELMNSTLARKQYRPLLNGLLLLWALAMLLMMLLSWLQADVSENSSAAAMASRPGTQTLSWNWFSTTPGALQPQIAATEVLQESRVNAELLGVLMSGDIASATIQRRGQPEAVYVTGDELERDVILLSVSPGFVVLDERGSRTRLSMRRSDELIQTSPAVQTARQARANQQQQNAGFALADMFAATPAEVDGVLGMRVDRLSDELRMLTEIQDGDVILRVGSDDIQALMSDPSRWLSYSAETSLPVTLIRNDSEITVYVNAFSLSASVLPNLPSELMP